jgi:ring-1,2-phenylacetyl-CoA epoxidase subunit PaaC
MNPSIQISKDSSVRYLLGIADLCLIHAQRLGEWSGHAPVLEEDIGLTNIALDLIGQTRALYSHVGRLEQAGHDEDQLAFLRDERDYLNPSLVELPKGDFAHTCLRNLAVSTLLSLLWEGLQKSKDPEVAAIAGKAIKESRYHQQHAADWCLRLGDGTEESARRMSLALKGLWPYVPELFEATPEDSAARACGLGPAWGDVEESWRTELDQVLKEACLAAPPAAAFRSYGRRGRHTEHMGYLLAEMQYLQRAFPEGAW